MTSSSVDPTEHSLQVLIERLLAGQTPLVSTDVALAFTFFGDVTAFLLSLDTRKSFYTPYS